MTDSSLPIQEEKKSSSKATYFGKWVSHGFQKAHQKIGVYGWIAIGLLFLLVGTVLHYERRENDLFGWKKMYRPSFFEDSWVRNLDRDLDRMNREIENMRVRHERLFRQSWEVPMNISGETRSVYSSTGDLQYSINARDGKLDGFVASSDEKRIAELLPKIQATGLTVQQNGTKLFFNGEAGKFDELLKILAK